MLCMNFYICNSRERQFFKYILLDKVVYRNISFFTKNKFKIFKYIAYRTSSYYDLFSIILFFCGNITLNKKYLEIDCYTILSISYF